MEIENLVHTNPIWKDRANFVIGINCSQKASPIKQREQLWARQISDNRFEICCIPFYVYDLALGDEVETDNEWDIPYMAQRVVSKSGHYTFRVWFKGSTNQSIRIELCQELGHLGCLMEWGSENLLAIDAATDSQAQTLADVLWHREQMGHLIYETGQS